MPELLPTAAIPWTDPTDIAFSPFGDVRGIGAIVPADGSLFDQRISHCYTGAKLDSSDGEISRCRLFNHRDACLWIAASAGNCQSLNNHCYGARIACYNEGGAQYRAVNDTYADAFVGHLGDWQGGGSNQSTLTNVLFQHNTVADCVFKATGCHLNNCIVNVQRDVKQWNTIDLPGIITRTGKIGVVLGTRCSIRGGTVELCGYKHTSHEYSGKPATAIVVWGDDVVIDTYLVDDDGVDGSIGIEMQGDRRCLRADCIVTGFHEPAARIFVAKGKCNGIDLTFRLDHMAKPPAGYIDVRPDFTGSIRLIDTSTGKTVALGRAA